MMFGAPTHRIESQIQATAKTLDIHCSVIYLVNFMIISFQDDETHTSDLRFIKQGSALDLNRLTQLATIHYEVTHDLIGVQEASVEISNLMRAPPLYSRWRMVLIGGLASVAIAPVSFHASFIDLLVSYGLGSILVIIQIWVASKSDVLSSLFEIVRRPARSADIAAHRDRRELRQRGAQLDRPLLLLGDHLVVDRARAARLADHDRGPRAAVALARVRVKRLKKADRAGVDQVCLEPFAIADDAPVRLVFALFCASRALVHALTVADSLLLGYGISIGATVRRGSTAALRLQIWAIIAKQDVASADDGLCTLAHSNAPWYRVTCAARGAASG